MYQKEIVSKHTAETEHNNIGMGDTTGIKDYLSCETEWYKYHMVALPYTAQPCSICLYVAYPLVCLYRLSVIKTAPTILD